MSRLTLRASDGATTFVKVLPLFPIVIHIATDGGGGGGGGEGSMVTAKNKLMSLLTSCQFLSSYFGAGRFLSGLVDTTISSGLVKVESNHPVQIVWGVIVVVGVTCCHNGPSC